MTPVVLLLAYPILVHAAVLTNSRWLTAAALVSLIVNAMWPWLRGFGRSTVPMVLVLFVIGFGIARVPMHEVLFYAAPILVLAVFLSLFANSLRPDHMPVATRVAESVRGGPCPRRVQRYTRGVTIYWCVVFTVLIVENIALALLASPVVWSLFANGGNYVVVGLAFAGELVCRRIVVGDHVHESMLTGLLTMRRMDWSRTVRARG